VGLVHPCKAVSIIEAPPGAYAINITLMTLPLYFVLVKHQHNGLDTREQILEIFKWITGHYDRRTLSLKQIREHFHLDCADVTLLRAFERYGYHYKVSDCKPFISKAISLSVGASLLLIGTERKSTSDEGGLQTKRLLALISFVSGKFFVNEEREED
jgi:hypothetical protein